jgi:hypothetical protein
MNNINETFDLLYYISTFLEYEDLCFLSAITKKSYKLRNMQIFELKKQKYHQPPFFYRKKILTRAEKDHDEQKNIYYMQNDVTYKEIIIDNKKIGFVQTKNYGQWEAYIYKNYVPFGLQIRKKIDLSEIYQNNSILVKKILLRWPDLIYDNKKLHPFTHINLNSVNSQEYGLTTSELNYFENIVVNATKKYRTNQIRFIYYFIKYFEEYINANILV